MMCPHCNKPIPYKQKIPDKIRAEVLKLHKQGYTARDIQDMLKISFSSAARIVRESKP